MNAKRPLLDYFVNQDTTSGGKEICYVMAFGTDGTMWVDPKAFGISPQHFEQLARFTGPAILFDNYLPAVFINARAVVEVKTDPAFRTQWLAYVEGMIKEHQQVRARYESTRSN